MRNFPYYTYLQQFGGEVVDAREMVTDATEKVTGASAKSLPKNDMTKGVTEIQVETEDRYEIVSMTYWVFNEVKRLQRILKKNLHIMEKFDQNIPEIKTGFNAIKAYVDTYTPFIEDTAKKIDIARSSDNIEDIKELKDEIAAVVDEARTAQKISEMTEIPRTIAITTIEHYLTIVKAHRDAALRYKIQVENLKEDAKSNTFYGEYIRPVQQHYTSIERVTNKIKKILENVTENENEPITVKHVSKVNDAAEDAERFIASINSLTEEAVKNVDDYIAQRNADLTEMFIWIGVSILVVLLFFAIGGLLFWYFESKLPSTRRLEDIKNKPKSLDEYVKSEAEELLMTKTFPRKYRVNYVKEDLTKQSAEYLLPACQKISKKYEKKYGKGLNCYPYLPNT